MIGSALSHFPRSDFCAEVVFGAVVIRLASGLQFCSPPRSLPPIRYVTEWEPWLLLPSTVKVVTFLHVGYASRLNRAIDGKGTLHPSDSRPCRPHPNPFNLLAYGLRACWPTLRNDHYFSLPKVSLLDGWLGLSMWGSTH